MHEIYDPWERVNGYKLQHRAKDLPKTVSFIEDAIEAATQALQLQQTVSSEIRTIISEQNLTVLDLDIQVSVI